MDRPQRGRHFPGLLALSVACLGGGISLVPLSMPTAARVATGHSRFAPTREKAFSPPPPKLQPFPSAPLAHFAVEKGGMRGGGTAPPAKNKRNDRVYREATDRMVWNAKRFKRKILCQRRVGDTRPPFPRPRLTRKRAYFLTRAHRRTVSPMPAASRPRYACPHERPRGGNKLLDVLMFVDYAKIRRTTP